MDLSIISTLASIITSLLGITAIIVFHEFGHYVFCKLFNVYTPTFSIGMGNVLFSKKIGHTNFCISAAPIGGYVEIATDEGIPGTKGFNQLYYYQKFLIMLGGIFCNFLMTYLIFVGLLFTGMPESGLPINIHSSKVIHIEKNSINYHHLQVNDIIQGLDNQTFNDEHPKMREILLKYLQKNETQVPANIKRNNEYIDIMLNIKPNEATLNNLLDITLEKKAPLTLKKSLIVGFELTKFCLFSIINALKQLFNGSSSKSLVGPIMTIALSSKSIKKGFSYFLLLLAIISINLGFMNLLPLPIFDGGQFVFFTIEAITRRKLSDRIQHLIGITSWILALGLMILSSLKDIYHLAENYFNKL